MRTPLPPRLACLALLALPWLGSGCCGPAPRIAFARGEGAGELFYDVWTVDPDGRDPTPLTRETDRDRGEPVWTEDGAQVVYTGWLTDRANNQLFRRPAEGGPEERLTDNTGDESGPSWCPATRRLYFASAAPGQRAVLVSRSADGRDERVLAEDGVDLLQPAISADGRQLAWTRWASPRRVYTLTLPGGAPALLLPEVAPDEQQWEPRWSPDGARLAFGRWLPARGNWDIWVVGRDGSGLVQVTRADADELQPAWSPDGGSLVFSRVVDDRTAHLWVVRLSDGHERQLTRGAVQDLAPDWR